LTQVQDVSSITNLGFPGKDLTSIKVASGITVFLYEGENFQGRCKRIDGPANLSHLSDFNDLTSSLRVVATSNIPQDVALKCQNMSNLQQTGSLSWVWWIVIIIIILLIIWIIARS